jgi:hypothetical protein
VSDLREAEAQKALVRMKHNTQRVAEQVLRSSHQAICAQCLPTPLGSCPDEPACRARCSEQVKLCVALHRHQDGTALSCFLLNKFISFYPISEQIQTF